MNIGRVTLIDFRSWQALDLAIEPGCTLLSGRNGAGKSSIIEAVLFGLYGATTDAARLVRRGARVATVELEVDLGDGAMLYLERAVLLSGRGAKVTLSIGVKEPGDEFATGRTAATVTETQAILDDLLGVSREVLLASAFSTQHGGAAFTEAKPAERKRIFGEILALGMWDRLHEEAKAEQRDARATASAAQVRADQLAGAEVRHGIAIDALWIAIEERTAAAQAEAKAEAEAARLAGEAEAAREARRKHQAAVEAASRARSDHERATQERTVADAALQRAKDATANAPSVDEARARARETMFELSAAEAALEDAIEAARQHGEALIQVRGDLADLEAENATGECARCGQALADASLPARLEDTRLAAARIEKLAPPAADRRPALAAREAAQAAQTRLAEAETIQALAGSIEAAQQRARDAIDREGDTAQALRIANAAVLTINSQNVSGDIEERHAQALRAVEDARRVHREAAAALATAEAAAQHAQRDASEEAAARTALAEATQREAIASILTAGFGPTGVPSLIIDNVLGQLADESNRVLTELGTPIRIDLRSQRVTRDSRLVDALDIIVLDGPEEAPYETLSGGERTRVALSLRAALTRLLAAKSGARVRVLVIDEPAGLDAAGAEAFADVLHAFTTAGIFETALIVTHDERLADRIDRVIRIEKTPGGTSRLVESARSGPYAEVPPRPSATQRPGPRAARAQAGAPNALTTTGAE